MSGPIVRTGTTPTFGENWDKIFGGKGSKRAATGTKAKAGVKTAARKAEKSVAKAAGKAKSAVAKATIRAKASVAKAKAKARKA